jgi:hypothetical protein
MMMPKDLMLSDNSRFRIIHPVFEFTQNSLSAYCHSIAISLAASANLDLVILKEKSQIPHVRTILENWGLLPLNSSHSDVGKLGISITKIIQKGDKEKIITHRLNKHKYDLLVLDINSNKNINILNKDIAKYISKKFRQTTLYIPLESKGFIDQKTGKIKIKKIIVPIKDEIFAINSLEFLYKFLSAIKITNPQITTLHCGKEFPFSSNKYFYNTPLTKICINQDVVNGIILKSLEFDADLIVMATKGRNTITRKLIGTTTEKVIRKSPCPILSVPI